MSEFRDWDQSRRDVYTIDERMGYRPRLGSATYSEYGTYRNVYPLEKRKGVSRVLFAGDSVTARARIVTALHEAYGDKEYEYWNAGVEGYNTIQELAYYKLFNYKINPDHVVLEFHLNDFETTPVTFLNKDGEPVLYAPNCPAREINRFWFQHLRLYRLYVGVSARGDASFARIASEVKEALNEFRELAKPARFTVVIFPILKPKQQWSRDETRAYTTIKAILQELAIRSFDLRPLAEAAADEGINLRESPNDIWHPSDEFARYIARRLKRGRVLEGDRIDDVLGKGTEADLATNKENAKH